MLQETKVHAPIHQPNQTTLAAIEDDQAESITLEELKAWLIETDSLRPLPYPLEFPHE